MTSDQFACSFAELLRIYRRNFILAAEQGKELAYSITPLESVSMLVGHSDPLSPASVNRGNGKKVAGFACLICSAT
jgi:hypothetical protein